MRIKYEALDCRFQYDKWYLMFMNNIWIKSFTAQTLKERNELVYNKHVQGKHRKQY